MRLFIAVELNNPIKTYLESLQQKLKDITSQGNFTPRSNLHLTLHFIGETPPWHVNCIQDAMNQYTQSSRPFRIYIDNLGYFTKGNKAIIWTGIQGDLEHLQNLHHNVEKGLNNAGFQTDARPYKPHITLAREVTMNNSLRSLLKQIHIKKKEMTVSGITLMESSREKGRLLYNSMYTVTFSENV